LQLGSAYENTFSSSVETLGLIEQSNQKTLFCISLLLEKYLR